MRWLVVLIFLVGCMSAESADKHTAEFLSMTDGEFRNKESYGKYWEVEVTVDGHSLTVYYNRFIGRDLIECENGDLYPLSDFLELGGEALGCYEQ